MGSSSPTLRWASGKYASNPPFLMMDRLFLTDCLRLQPRFCHRRRWIRMHMEGCCHREVRQCFLPQCLYHQIDTNIEVFDTKAKTCFSACPACTPPMCLDSKMTDCYEPQVLLGHQPPDDACGAQRPVDEGLPGRGPGGRRPPGGSPDLSDRQYLQGLPAVTIR